MTLNLRAVEPILQEARELADYVSEGPLCRQPTVDRMATLLRQLCEATETRNAHCRALRAVLRMHVCHRDGYLPTCVEYAALHKGAHRPECAQSVAVLAQATDKEGQ